MGWNAQVWIKWNGKHDESDWTWLNDMSEVQRAWTTMGDWDCCLEVHASTPEQLEDFVWKKLRSQPGIWNTRSTWSKEVWSRA